MCVNSVDELYQNPVISVSVQLNILARLCNARVTHEFTFTAAEKVCLSSLNTRHLVTQLDRHYSKCWSGTPVSLLTLPKLVQDANSGTRTILITPLIDRGSSRRFGSQTDLGDIPQERKKKKNRKKKKKKEERKIKEDFSGNLR